MLFLFFPLKRSALNQNYLIINYSVNFLLLKAVLGGSEDFIIYQELNGVYRQQIYFHS